MSLIGCRPYNFEDDKGKKLSGLSLFYTAPDEYDESLKGDVAGKLSVNAGTPLYDKILGLSFSQGPIDCDAVYSIKPGSKVARLVDIQL